MVSRASGVNTAVESRSHRLIRPLTIPLHPAKVTRGLWKAAGQFSSWKLFAQHLTLPVSILHSLSTVDLTLW